MSLKLTHDVVLQRTTINQLNPDKVVQQIKKIKERALASGRGDRGWTCKSEPGSVRSLNNKNHTQFILHFTYAPKRDKTQEQVDSELSNIVQIVSTAGNASDWTVVSVNGRNPSLLAATVNEEGQKKVGYAPVAIPKDWMKFFDHLYDREAQIDIIYSYIQAAIDSDWSNRFHAALVGEPAGGKTETARTFKKMVGDAAVLELDATSTTQAGIQRELNERDELPRIIIIEEIEKADFKQLPWLLGMLDPRAEIRKLNVRTKMHLEAKMLCIATVNNYRLFKSVLEGALASRFGEPIFFPRPGEDVLRKILEREIAKIEGNMKWIDPVLEYAKEANITDPRNIIAICLAGRDGLIKKTYQDKLRKTRMPADYGERHTES